MDPKIYLLFVIFAGIVGSPYLREARVFMRKRQFARLQKERDALSTQNP